ncbi:spore coat protein [Lysinibacillus sphaericus]
MGYQNSRKNCSDNEETIVNPTRRIVKTRTNERVVNNVHPTEIVEVNRTIVKNRNYYPVTRSQVNETVVENYECSGEVGSGNCRRVGGASDNGNGSVRGASYNNNGRVRGEYDDGYGRGCGCRRRCRWF